ncbi:MAG: WYL domain-containing protein [Acutalibacteraceae bacterium]|nr:WYL domain-containing protein [Acutalibacteraceae bacterium]
MAKGPNQKLKLLVLRDILMQYSDEQHGLTINEIIDKLAANGINAERKSIYDDLRLLENYGLDICSEKTKTVRYYIGKRDFELPELKLLVDAVQSSKFITEKKSRELIKKVGALASDYDASKLSRQVFVHNRVKNPNEKIYYAVDVIHEAISSKRQITFCYYEWVLETDTVSKIVKKPRHNGKIYRVSPFSLTWDDENYYLIAFDSEASQIRHYRVDKMDKVKLTKELCEGKTLFKDFDMASYSKSVFGMFGGEMTEVKIRVRNNLAGVVADRFGKDIFVKADGNGCFTFSAKVVLSPQFFGWIFALGSDAELLSPQSAVKTYKEYLESAAKVYEI